MKIIMDAELDKFDFDDNMAKIKELSSIMEIKGFGEEFWKKESSHIIYTMVKGTCEGWNILNNEKIAVQYFQMSADSEFPTHSHERQREILIIYEGDITSLNIYHIQSVEHTGILWVDIGINHVVKSKNGCKGIAITIPASEGYPDGK